MKFRFVSISFEAMTAASKLWMNIYLISLFIHLSYRLLCTELKVVYSQKAGMSCGMNRDSARKEIAFSKMHIPRRI